MKQASFKDPYSSPLSSGDRCLVSYLNINTIRAKCRSSVRPQPGGPGSCKGQERMKRAPFDLSLLHGNSLHVGRANQFGGYFPPQLPPLSTPEAQWQDDH